MLEVTRKQQKKFYNISANSMFIIARKSQASVKKIFEEKKSIDEIVPQDQKISLDIADVKNHYEQTKAAFNRIYYVSGGVMHVHIKNQDFELNKGDACFVEKGTIFELQGSFSVIIVSNPPLTI